VVEDSAGVDLLLAPRRYVLDDVLARAAVHAGAELLTGVTVTAAVRDASGRVTGVVARDAQGRPLELTARLVVGADGVHSRMAGLLGAEAVARYAPGGGCLYTYVGDVPWNGFEFHISETAFAGVFPTHDDQACVWLMRPTELLAPVLKAGARRSEAWLDALGGAAPELAERVGSGSVTAPLRGAVDLPNQLRRAAGPGWALVGDAGYHRDPITGHGITDAFRDAELLAEVADDLLEGMEPEAHALAGYQAARDAAIADVFALTRALGAFPEPETFMGLQARLNKAYEREAQAPAARPVPVGTAVTTAA
jgi:flavin-dependent dehydrogenase